MLAGWNTLDTQNITLISLMRRLRAWRPLKRLLDGYSRKAETGHLLV